MYPKFLIQNYTLNNIMMVFKVLSFIILCDTLILAQLYYPGEASCLTPDKELGKCVTINNCNSIQAYINNNREKRNVLNILTNYKCGYEKLKLKVCCPLNPNTPINGNIIGDGDTKILNRERKSDLLPTNCGIIKNGDRIINGNEVDLMEFPWMALISYQGSNRIFRCGGTIINSRYILTAAHCIKQSAFRATGIRVGEHNIKTDEDCKREGNGKKCAPPVQDLRIEQITIHPNFKSDNYINDIALIRTVTPIDLTKENVNAICLPPINSKTLSSTTGIIAGWGTMKARDVILNDELLKGMTMIVPNDRCNSIFSKYKLRQPLNHQQFCIKGQSAECNGDSGGPFFTPEKYKSSGYRYVQQGIISFGVNPCGKYPSVYTRVSAYMDWILENIKP